MNNKKRLIEVSLPLGRISEQSAREKSIRHGHISTLHIWWARRPLAAMRAAIFASLLPAPETEKERKELEKLIEVIVDWDQVKDGNSEAIFKARQLIQEAYPDGPPKLLDPFMGGGATGLEALRLGCETHAVELNPVAHLIELSTLVYPQKFGKQTKCIVKHGGIEVEETANLLVEEVRKWAGWVQERVKAQIGYLYQNPISDEVIVGYIWARTIECPNPSCRATMPLAKSWWLSKKKNRRVAIRPIIDSGHKSVTFEIVRDKNIDFDPSDGTMARLSANCLVCGQVTDAKHIQNEAQLGNMGQIPLAIIYERKKNSGKGFRAFSEEDIQLYNNAVELLKRHSEQTRDGLEPIPQEPLPYLRSIFNVSVYGIAEWGSLFNQRQALTLSTFCQQVEIAYTTMVQEGMDGEKAKAVATYLGLIIDRLADQSATLVTWIYQIEAISHVFTRQALGMVWDYIETNPLSGGGGSFEGGLDWVLRVIEHSSKASSFPATTHQGTANRLGYTDNFFDTIITDPPYYDAVPYADLSDFFYVWLKRSIGFLYPDIFRTPLTPKSMEIVQLAGRNKRYDHKDKSFYEQNMTLAFKEARRTLKPDGILVIVFAHKSITAWETLLNSLLYAGLIVTASWPLHTERSVRLRAQGSAALASSIFIVCRVRTTEKDGYIDDIHSELQNIVKERLDFFWEQGIRGADFFISAIGPAVSVFGRYSKVYNLDGSEVGVAELLDLVQQLVADYALDRILNGQRASVGAVDAPTRYYILHRWAYAGNDVPFDDAMRLAMALGADIDALMDSRGVLKQSGDSVKLLNPKQRGKREDLGQPDRSGRIASVVDVLHQAVILWESGQRESLSRFLSENAHGREEQMRLVAQTLIDILPQDDKERRLLEGFLAGRENLPETPQQRRLL